MRCPDCSRMVSYDTEVEPEVTNDPSVEDGTVTVEVKRVLTCAECGTELKETEFSVDVDVSGAMGECDKAPLEEDGSKGEHDWEVEVDAQPTTGVINKDRKGRTITNPRYMTTTYGVDITATLTCAHCGEHVEFIASDETPASSMDELV